MPIDKASDIVHTYLDVLAPSIAAYNSTGNCQQSPQQYEANFQFLMKKTYILMGLPESSIDAKLVEETKQMYDNCVGAAICSGKSASLSNNEQWKSEMGQLLQKLGPANSPAPSEELKQATVDVFQARVQYIRCQMCIL